MQAPISFQPRSRNPVSNAERQRQFRERNPGYYGRRHRKRKQQFVVSAAAKQVALAMGLTESAATAVGYLVAVKEVHLLLAIAQAKRPLMLPAPAETLRIPGVNAIPTRAELAAMTAERAAS